MTYLIFDLELFKNEFLGFAGVQRVVEDADQPQNLGFMVADFVINGPQGPFNLDNPLLNPVPLVENISDFSLQSALQTCSSLLHGLKVSLTKVQMNLKSLDFGKKFRKFLFQLSEKGLLLFNCELGSGSHGTKFGNLGSDLVDLHSLLHDTLSDITDLVSQL